jgi:hypothetical protein
MVETPEQLRKHAFGGDVVNIELNGSFPYERLGENEAMSFVTGAVMQVDARSIGVIVDEADTSMLRLLDWASSRDLEISSTAIYRIPCR